MRAARRKPSRVPSRKPSRRRAGPAPRSFLASEQNGRAVDRPLSYRAARIEVKIVPDLGGEAESRSWMDPEIDQIRKRDMVSVAIPIGEQIQLRIRGHSDADLGREAYRRDDSAFDLPVAQIVVGGRNLDERNKPDLCGRASFGEMPFVADDEVAGARNMIACAVDARGDMNVGRKSDFQI